MTIDNEQTELEAKYLKELQDERARIDAALLEQGYTVIDGVVTEIKKDKSNDHR